MPTERDLNTVAKVRLSDGAIVASGLPDVPKQIRTWIRAHGAAVQFNPKSVIESVGQSVPAEHDGVGYFPEYQIDADFNPSTHRLDGLQDGFLDNQNNRVVYARSAVALTQAEMDAIAVANAEKRDFRAKTLTSSVKSAAEAARTQFLTPGSGKASEYEAKRSEAMRYLAAKDAAAPSDPTINGTLYPWAYDTAKELAGGEPSTAQIKAQCELFSARAVAWEAIGRQIAAKEQAATEAIETARAAGDDAAMEAAAVVAWPAPGGSQ